MKNLALGVLLSLAAALPAQAGYEWPVRGVYDGDTVYITMPGLPQELRRMSVRLNGLDTPEKGGRADCIEERAMANRATRMLTEWVAAADRIEFVRPKWGKWAGRVVATMRIWIDGKPFDPAALLIQAGVARPYDGGKRQGWCE